MLSIFDDPDYWNMRAELIVTRLAQVKSRVERDTLLRLHENYVRLASAAVILAQAAERPACWLDARVPRRTAR
ncbi:MAG: hypothetical protein ACLPWS_03050 [Rhodomicrobium sp.]